MKYKKAITVICLVFYLLALGGCSQPPVSNELKTDVQHYLQVNTFVENYLSENFTGLLPSKEKVNETSEYYYSYSCGTFGDPNFIVYLNSSYDEDVFSKEQKRLSSLAVRVSSVKDKTVCFVKEIDKSISMYLDDKIYDGFAIEFEIAIIAPDKNTIQYLSALQQDNHERSEIIDAFLSQIPYDVLSNAD